MWQVEFRNLNWVIDGGEQYQFFVDGTWIRGGENNIFPALHATNASLAGARQDGADGLYRVMQVLGDTPEYIGTFNSDQNGTPGTFSIDGHNGKGGWDKSSDINVQVWAYPLMITIGGCRTGIENQFYKGQFLSEYVDSFVTNARNRGQALKSIKGFTRELVKAGVLDGRQKEALEACADHLRLP